jgi:hypothetical protein
MRVANTMPHQADTILPVGAMIPIQTLKVTRLLDAKTNPNKPQYDMASDLPLVLYDCEFNNLNPWIQRPGTHARLCNHMHTMWKEYAIKAALVDGMLASFGEAFVGDELVGGYFGAGKILGFRFTLEEAFRSHDGA